MPNLLKFNDLPVLCDRLWSKSWPCSLLLSKRWPQSKWFLFGLCRLSGCQKCHKYDILWCLWHFKPFSKSYFKLHLWVWKRVPIREWDMFGYLWRWKITRFIGWLWRWKSKKWRWLFRIMHNRNGIWLLHPKQWYAISMLQKNLVLD